MKIAVVGLGTALSRVTGFLRTAAIEPEPSGVAAPMRPTTNCCIGGAMTT